MLVGCHWLNPLPTPALTPLGIFRWHRGLGQDGAPCLLVKIWLQHFIQETLSEQHQASPGICSGLQDFAWKTNMAESSRISVRRQLRQIPSFPNGGVEKREG